MTEHPRVYDIRVKGHLESGWLDWFEGIEISNLEDGQALLSGAFPDQAALHGVLARIRDLNIPLVSVKVREEGE